MNGITYITLVDDHILLRTGLAALVNSFTGYKVLFEADHGQDFIDQVKPRMAPNIVLLDITMPVMNGYETAKWIRVNLPETKMLVLSMMENDAAIIRMLKHGANGYLLKDSKPAVFKEALNAVRDHGFYLNELVSSKMLHYMNKGESLSGSTPGLADITERELSFLKLACSEKSYREIAEEMFVSPRTVDSYRDSLFEKLGCTTRIGLVLFAIRNGIATP